MRADRQRIAPSLASFAGACILGPVLAAANTYPAQDMAYGGQPDGIVRVAFDLAGDDNDSATAAVAISADHLLLGGSVQLSTLPTSDFGFAQLDATGALDSAFGQANDGRALAGMMPAISLQRIARTADGHYLFLGKTSDAVAVIGRMDASGGLDTSFNGTGRRNLGAGFFVDAGTSLQMSGLVSLPDGKLLVSGYAGSAATVCAAVGRFNADGSTDTTFGGGTGRACESPLQQTTRAAGAFAITRTADGKLLLGGTAVHPGGSGFDMAVARFSADGMLEMSFGPAHDGWAYVAFDRGGTLNDYVHALAVDPQDRIVLAGQIDGTTDYDIGVARLLPDGAIDTTFATNGIAALDLELGGYSGDFVHSIFLLPDRHILLGGYSQKSNTVGTAIEFKPDGTLDRAFGTGGIFLQTDPDAEESAILMSQSMVVSGDYMYMVGSIVNPVWLPNFTRNYDFGAVRYALPLFSDGFDSR
jgi:uncharacterized delta-60 repeat protein